MTATLVDRPTAQAPTARLKVRAETERSALRIYLGMVSTIVTVLLAMLAAVTIVIAVASRFSPKGQYTIFGHPAMVVLSGSMSPVIRTGDFIIDSPVTTTQAEHLHVGQIVSFHESPHSITIITHRIVGVTSVDGAVAYLTKGDANNAADATPRPASDVVGVFDRTIHRGGYFLTNLHKPEVLGLLLAAPVLWFMAAPLYNFATEPDTQPEPQPAQTADPIQVRTRRRHAPPRHRAKRAHLRRGTHATTWSIRREGGSP